MLSIIVAADENNAIGKNNSLMWHISEDMKYFKSVTGGYPVIMGRKTFESIRRPLPDRTNIIVTHNLGFKPEGCITVHSLSAAIEAAAGIRGDYFVIGGESIYREAMDLAEAIYLTAVHHKYEGADAFFPKINEREWRVTERVDFERGKNFEYPFSFVKLQKIPNLT
ncbi:MAG: dihydrofolate reductase [Prevotellaceae bacterium]|jgi:dihydrofolate reductase|nr:dihydrofolate reductase [Prevotellaceae bacterium]